MKTENIKQSVIEKLVIIANQDHGVQLTREEADFLNIASLDDETILEEREGSDVK